MKPFACFTAALLLCSTLILSQNTFSRIYGNSTYHIGYAVKQCSDGGYIVSGYARPAGQYNFYVVRLDSVGDTLWTRIFGGDNMVAFDVIQTSDDGFLLGGYKNSTSPYQHLIRLDANGNTLWARNVLPGWAQSILEVNSGGYLLAGSGLTRTDAAGYVVWTRNPGFQAMYAIQNPDSTFIVAGFKTDSVVISKRDTSGYAIWTKAYPGALYNTFNPCNNMLARTSDGGYIMSAMVSDVNFSIQLLRMNSAGDTLWRRVVPGLEGEAVVQTYDGGFAVCGWDSVGNDMRLVRTNPNGIPIWTRNYDYFGSNAWAQSMRETSDYGLVIAGTSTDGGPWFFVVKTDSAGFIAPSGINTPSGPQHPAIFPNPANDHVDIAFHHPVTNATVAIVNALGEIVNRTEQVHGLQLTIDVSQLSNGMYTVLVNEDGILSNSALVISR